MMVITLNMEFLKPQDNRFSNHRSIDTQTAGTPDKKL